MWLGETFCLPCEISHTKQKIQVGAMFTKKNVDKELFKIFFKINLDASY